MTTRHIQQFTLACVKYFFDFDHTLCNNIFTMGAIAICVLKYMITRTRTHLQNGLCAVREDLLTIRTSVDATRERWENSTIRERLINNSRFLTK